MRFWLLAVVEVACIFLLPRLAEGQQTEAQYVISGASTNMTVDTLAGAGLPSYSSLILTDLTSVVVGVDACPAGAYSLDDAQVCTLCPAGKYSGTVAATSSATCISCDAGTYSTAAGASSGQTCTNCPNGTYSSTIGASVAGTCLPCPANSSSYPGSKLLQACVCLPGFSGSNGGACSPCNSSTWCLYGQTYPCPPNSRSGPMSSSLGQCLCVGGFYGDSSMGGPDLTVCQVCQRDRWCPGMAVNASYACPDGKYSLPGSDNVGACICPDFSTSKLNSKSVTACVCQDGYFQQFSDNYPIGGWFCAPCNPGQECYNGMNYSCPVHSYSYALAKSYLDCWCLSGFYNSTNRTEQDFCWDCPVNKYCTGKGAVESCVANAVSPVQSASYTACTCDLGYKGLNNTPCVACQSPTFCYAGIQAQCSEGTFSPPLAWDRLNCSCQAGKLVCFSLVEFL